MYTTTVRNRTQTAHEIDQVKVNLARIAVQLGSGSINSETARIHIEGMVMRLAALTQPA